MDGGNWLLVARVDGLKCLSFLSFYPLAIDVQAERLLVRDAWGLDLLGQRHVRVIESGSIDWARLRTVSIKEGEIEISGGLC